MKKYFRLVLVVIGISTVLQSCHIGASGSWKDGRIDPKIKNDIGSLNKKLFESIANKDISGVKSLMSPVLVKKSGGKLDSIITSFAEGFKGVDYSTLNDFYVKNTTTNVTNTVFSGLGNNDYILNYLALNNEMYVSVVVSKNLPVNFVVLAIYGKYGDNWKLNIIQVGKYSILGKTAPEYYTTAIDLYKKGFLIDAADMILTACEIASPGGSYWQYKNNDEMKAFYSKVINEANTVYHFPITVGKVKTNPQVFAINPQYITEKGHEGIYPFVKYKSEIPLEDTIALKNENEALQKCIGGIFKGIDQNKDCVLYWAFNKMPDFKTGYNPNMPVKHYGFVQKLK